MPSFEGVGERLALIAGGALALALVQLLQAKIAMDVTRKSSRNRRSEVTPGPYIDTTHSQSDDRASYEENSLISLEILVTVRQFFPFAVIPKVASSCFRSICSFGTVRSHNHCFFYSFRQNVLPAGFNDSSQEGSSHYTRQVFRDLGYTGHTREDMCMRPSSRRREPSNHV